MAPTRHPLGTHPDVPDHRDHRYRVPSRLERSRPPAVDLRRFCPPVYDQGKLNSCSANAIAAALWFEEIKASAPEPWSPSRLFIYYNERAREGVVSRNAPASLRDGYKSVAKIGVCHERQWPYHEARFATKPPGRCYRGARSDRVIRYLRLRQELRDFEACLAQGYPFTMGISVYESFKGKGVARKGIVPMPLRREKHLGGHALLVVGYDRGRRRFVVRNSWGSGWGLGGYCLMPYAYLANPDLAWDFWTVRRISIRRGEERRPRSGSLGVGSGRKLIEVLTRSARRR
jgi:C1A family cysteine protease